MLTRSLKSSSGLPTRTWAWYGLGAAEPHGHCGLGAAEPLLLLLLHGVARAAPCPLPSPAPCSLAMRTPHLPHPPAPCPALPEQAQKEGNTTVTQHIETALRAALEAKQVGRVLRPAGGGSSRVSRRPGPYPRCSSQQEERNTHLV